MASIKDGLRPVVRTMVFDTLDEAQGEQDRHQEEAPEYRTAIHRRVVRVDGVVLTVFVLVVRDPQVGPSEERARKKAAQSCRRAWTRLLWLRLDEDRAAAGLLQRAELSALLLPGGF